MNDERREIGKDSRGYFAQTKRPSFFNFLLSCFPY
jgi:hypothetical protein